MSGADRREQLLDVALDLFARNGFESTTVRDIATAANVTDGLIYRYFASKEELLNQVIERAGRQFDDLDLRQFAERSARDAIALTLIQLARFLHAHMALMDLCWIERCHGTVTGQELLTIHERMMAVVMALLQGLEQRQEIRNTDLERNSRLLMGIVFSFVFGRRHILSDPPTETELSEFAIHAAGVFVDGLRPR